MHFLMSNPRPKGRGYFLRSHAPVTLISFGVIRCRKIERYVFRCHFEKPFSRSHPIASC
jgi:hypothetical protein